MKTQNQFSLLTGEKTPLLGMGTWYMGENLRLLKEEHASLKLGLEQGLNLIDTAEMYGDGQAETLVGQVIEGVRSQVYLVSKVLPQNADRRRLKKACENSLKRLQTDYLDLYLLHWRGSTPLEETIDIFDELISEGKILRWGVSNFSLTDMKDLLGTPGGERVATNQILYNLNQRGIEWDLLPYCREHHIPLMAYSPLDHGKIKGAALDKVALRHEATSYQVALAWLLQNQDIISISKSSSLKHTQTNIDSLTIKLSPEDVRDLNEAFPPPQKPQPLQVY